MRPLRELVLSFYCNLVLVVQSLSHVRLFVTPWTAACQVSWTFTTSRSLLKLMFIESVMPSNHLILPFFSCLQSFPAIGSFLMSWLFASGGQSIGTSASALSMSIQGWLPLGLTGWISLQSKSSPTPQFKSIHSLALSFLYSPTLTSVHDH